MRTEFVLLSYNIHSAMTQPRIDALLDELVPSQWDLVVLSETWRDAEHEELHFESGHRFFGSGGTKGSCGVGFLVHEGLSVRNF